jgi:ribbon-helix-helix CopG family protein
MVERPHRKRGKRKARNPTGLRPGELSSEYPQVTVRVPGESVERLRQLAKARGVPQWRILHEAIQALRK